MKDFQPGGIICIENEDVGLLDSINITQYGPYKVQEEVLGIKDGNSNDILLDDSFG